MKQSSNNLLASLDYKIRREKNSCFKCKIRMWIEEDSVRFGRLKYTRWGGSVPVEYGFLDEKRLFAFLQSDTNLFRGFLWREKGDAWSSFPYYCPAVALRIYAWSIREKACNESAKLFHDGRDILWYSTLARLTLISRYRNFEMKSVSHHPRLEKNDRTRVFPKSFLLNWEISNNSLFSKFEFLIYRRGQCLYNATFFHPFSYQSIPSFLRQSCHRETTLVLITDGTDEIRSDLSNLCPFHLSCSVISSHRFFQRILISIYYLYRSPLLDFRPPQRIFPFEGIPLRVSTYQLAANSTSFMNLSPTIYHPDSMIVRPRLEGTVIIDRDKNRVFSREISETRREGRGIESWKKKLEMVAEVTAWWGVEFRGEYRIVYWRRRKWATSNS